MSDDTSHPEVKRGIIDGLLHGSRDLQLQKANTLLSKKGDSAEERIVELSNLEENHHRASRGNLLRFILGMIC